jgi:hypothetical protein
MDELGFRGAAPGVGAKTIESARALLPPAKAYLLTVRVEASE